MKILSIALLLTLASCADPERCVKRAMFLNYDKNSPTGITVEQAMKICGVK